MERRFKIGMLSLALIAGILFIASNNPSGNYKNPLSKENMDLKAKPQKDFYRFVNGGWMDANPIPDEESSYSVTTQIRDENKENVKKIVLEVSKNTYDKGTHEQLVSDFFSSAMDTIAINKLGFEPIKPILSQIDGIKSKENIWTQLAELQNIGIAPAFHFGSTVDLKNSTQNIGFLWQTGTVLPDRDYYLQKGEYFDNVREAYKILIKDMFELCNYSTDEATKNAELVFKFEYKFAEAQYPMLKLRNPNAIYNPGNIDSLNKLVPNIAWEEFFKLRGIDIPEKINIAQPEFMANFNSMLDEFKVEDWKVFLKWVVIIRNADYLSNDFVMSDFEFFGKVLRGSEKIRPRWKRMIDITSGVVGEAIGKVYVKEHFSEKAKQKMTDLVLNLKEAMKVRIGTLDWMGEITKKQALDKLQSMTFMIGYPDEWETYAGLEISKESFFQNLMNARKWHVNESIQDIGKPVDKKEWPLNPQDVNAGYIPTRNQIVFPAGILQPPFFSVDADDALNYGAIGVVIGHEMTHGFDDKGRLYDKEGNLTNWWQEEDNTNFTARAEVLIKQFNEFIIVDTMRANGALTIGENIADLGGLNIAFTAYNIANKNTDNHIKIGGFTPEQRFFIAYAHIWAQNIRDEEKIRLTKQDVHSLGRNRVMGPLRNMGEFHKAFEIKKGDDMFIEESQRASIW